MAHSFEKACGYGQYYKELSRECTDCVCLEYKTNTFKAVEERCERFCHDQTEDIYPASVPIVGITVFTVMIIVFIISTIFCCAFKKEIRTLCPMFYGLRCGHSTGRPVDNRNNVTNARSKLK